MYFTGMMVAELSLTYFQFHSRITKKSAKIYHKWPHMTSGWPLVDLDFNIFGFFIPDFLWPSMRTFIEFQSFFAVLAVFLIFWFFSITEIEKWPKTGQNGLKLKKLLINSNSKSGMANLKMWLFYRFDLNFWNFWNHAIFDQLVTYFPRLIARRY